MLLFCASLVRGAHAPDLWTLTTADFKTERVSLRALMGRGYQVVSVSWGESRRLSRDQFLEIQRGISTAPAASSRFIAHLADGNRFTGEPASTSGETINWSSKALGEIKLSMRNLLAISRADATIDLSGNQPRMEDLILLSNGDTVRGVIASVSSSGASVQPATGGEPTSVPIDSIAAIHFASTGATTSTPSAPAASSFRVTLADGTSLSVAKPSITSGSLQLDGADGTVSSIPLISVTSIEQVN